MEQLNVFKDVSIKDDLKDIEFEHELRSLSPKDRYIKLFLHHSKVNKGKHHTKKKKRKNR